MQTCIYPSLKAFSTVAFFILGIASSFTASGQTPGDIYRVAGDYTAGSGCGGGTATATHLYSPSGVAVDTSGNLYIADYEQDRICKVTVSTGAITTIAGTGVQGHSGDLGLATSATLNGPLAIAVDSSGNVYFTEIGSSIVRMVTSSGYISTIAGMAGTFSYSGDGGLATSAAVNQPEGIAVDPGGTTVYISDTFNNRVRAINMSTGYISSIAGTGSGGFTGDGGLATSAELSTPIGIALDYAGNLYFADYDNSRIREISGGYISTVAGNGTAGNTGDSGAATGASIYAFGVTVNAAGELRRLCTSSATLA